MTELRALTSARGLAAWLVVIYHIRLSIAGLPDGLRVVLGKGYLAVDFFFLLSGFVIWLTWHDRLRSSGIAGIPQFLQKRIARIWPLHLAILLATVALAILLVATGRPDPAYPFAELPLHLLLVQNWGFTTTLRWNDPAWSISCELAAYLLFPLLVLAIDWRRVPAAILFAIAAGLLMTLHLVMADQPGLGADIPRYGLIRCLTEFACGTIVAALWLRMRHYSAVPAMLAAVLLLACWWLGAAETLVVPAASAFALLALATVRDTWLERRIVHWLGEISYATYLSHFLLWKLFKLVAVRDASAVSLPMIALYLLALLVESAGLYHLLERPAQRRINAWPVRRVLPRVPRRAR